MGSSAKRKELKRFGERKMRAVSSKNSPSKAPTIMEGSKKKATIVKRRLSMSFRGHIVPKTTQDPKNEPEQLRARVSCDTVTLRSCDTTSLNTEYVTRVSLIYDLLTLPVAD